MTLSRRSELRRTTPLQAHTRLERATRLPAPVAPLQRTGRLKRGSGPSSRPSAAQRDSWQQWAAVKVQAWELWGRRCVPHGHPLAWEAMHGHHRLMRSAGGPDSLANCLPVCHEAHEAIHRAGNPSYDRGHLVRSWGRPDTWPIHALGGIWLVTDDGDRWAV